MVEFAYNNAKNARIGHTLFEFNCRYYPQASYKKNLDLHSKLNTVKKTFFRALKIYNHFSVEPLPCTKVLKVSL